MTGRRAEGWHAAPVEVVRPALVESGDVLVSLARGVPTRKHGDSSPTSARESWIPDTPSRDPDSGRNC
jgi:hypothetical protein